MSAQKIRTALGLLQDDADNESAWLELQDAITAWDDAGKAYVGAIPMDAPAGELTLSRAKQLTLAGWKRPVKAKKA